MPVSPESPLRNRVTLWCAIALALASCLPVLVAQYPQMSDYPAHLARYHVMLDGGQSADLARYYGFTWAWTGNLGVDILIHPFAAIFGLEAGGRIIVGLIAVLTGLGIIAVDVVLRGRVTIASFLAFTMIWGTMLLTGLINFALGQAVALWGFAGWVALREWRWRWAVYLPFGVVVWLCHLSAWGALGVMVLGYEWHHRNNWRAFVACWPLALPFIPLLFGHWLFGAGTSGDFSYGEGVWSFKRWIWLAALRDTDYLLDRRGLDFIWLILGVAALMRRIDARVGWGAALLLIISVLMPRHISGGDYADYRMLTSGLLVACLAIDWNANQAVYREPPVWITCLAPVMYLARLLVTTASWQADSAETGQLLAALDHLPRGCRVASAVVVPAAKWPLDHFEHIGAYAAVRRDCLTNANFAVPHIHMLHLNQPFAVDPSQRVILGDDQTVDMAHFKPAENADYLWYVGARDPDTMPAGAVVVWRYGHSLLARLAKPGPVLQNR